LLVAFGERDVELAEDAAGAVLALSGYARDGIEPVPASELLARWRRSGPALLDDLSGEFSIAVVTEDGVWIARDRVGARPMYLTILANGACVFATSIRLLLAAGARRDIDADAIVRSLVLGYVPAPQTALAGIEQLAPGEWRQLAPRQRSCRYYRPRERVTRGRRLPTAARQLGKALDTAVRGALPGTGRVGAFLSGGLDSSLVLAELHRLGRPVEAFTLHFGDRVPGELRYARAVASHLGVPHHVLELDARAFCDGIGPALFELEDLLSEPIAVPNFLLARLASRHVDVLFTGEGGDPSFGGPKNVGLVLAAAYRHHPRAQSASEAYCAAHHHLYEDLGVALTPAFASGFIAARLQDELIAPWIDAAAGCRGDTFVGRLMAANTALKGGNNILVKVSKMVGAYDLALRSPLFAPEVVKLALTIPPWQKLHGTDEKLVLKRVASRLLPREVVERPKRGMAVPLAAWLREDLGELARDVLTERRVRIRGVFRWPYVRRLLLHEDLPTDLARSRGAEKLWLVLITELYFQSLERQVRTVARA
jgi:asparagine synthase (glutamine-hydrolysing)